MLIQCPARGGRKIHSDLDCKPNQNNPACQACQARIDSKKLWIVKADEGRGTDRVPATSRKKPHHKPSKLKHVEKLETFRAMAWAYLTLIFLDQPSERENQARQELSKYFEWKLEEKTGEIIKQAESGNQKWVSLVFKALGCDAYLEPWVIQGLALLCSKGKTVQIPPHRGEIPEHLQTLPAMRKAEERLDRGKDYDQVFPNKTGYKYTRDFANEKEIDEIHWLIGLNRERYHRHLLEDYGMLPKETLTDILDELDL